MVSHENGFLEFPEYFGRAPLPTLHVVSLFAVAVFFAISGFIIACSSLDDQWHPRMAVGGFLARRAVRILPFFWICTLGYNILSAAGTHVLDGAAMVRTLVLWPVGSLKPNVAWSLRHEALFYAVFAVTAIAWPRWRAAGVAWLLAPLVFAPLIWDFHVIGEQDGASGYDLFRLLLAGGESGANLQFGVGLCIGLAHVRGQSGRTRRPLALRHLVALFAAACVVVYMTDLPSGMSRMVLWTLLSGLIVLAACRVAAGDGVADRVALSLGNGSFSLYLMHNTVMLIVLAVTMKAHFAPHGEVALLAYLAMCILASLAGCQILHLWVEKPVMRWCSAWIPSRSPGRIDHD